MLSALQQVVRLVLSMYRHSVRKQERRQGELLVLLSTQSRFQTFTVAAAGPWLVFLKGGIAEVAEKLSSLISLCDCPHQEELGRFSDNFESLPFVCSFQVDQDSQDVETETERFLQRVSLVNSQIKIIFKVKNKEYTRQQIFSLKRRHKQPVMGHFFARDSTASPFSVESHPSCVQMHLVLGEKIPLLLPSEAVEAGLCGEMSITSLATLTPCMKQYPSWPTRLSHIRVLVYSPSGIPVMRGEAQTQLSFLQSLPGSLCWGKLGLAGVHCADTHTEQASLFYEREFSAEDEHSPETSQSVYSQAVSEGLKSEVCTVEQSVTIFLLIQHRDPFSSQLFDFITSEEILERQLDRVLWHNAERMRSALQALLENTLREFLKRKKARKKLQSAMSVILSSVISIVSSSTNAEFRSACLNSMKVQTTKDLSVSLHQALQRVMGGRFVSSRMCSTEKAVETVVTEENESEGLDQSCDPPGLLGKRAERETEESPAVFKRWCSGIIDGEWDSPVSSWEALDSQMTPPSSSQQSLRQNEMDLTRSSATSESTTELKEQQEIEREWFQELQNFSEWD